MAKAFYVDVVLMGKNRAEVSATLISADQPIDPAVEKSLLDKLGSRRDVVWPGPMREARNERHRLTRP